MDIIKGSNEKYCAEKSKCRNEDTEKCKQCVHNKLAIADELYNRFEQKADKMSIPIARECLYCTNKRSHGGSCDTKGSYNAPSKHGEACLSFIFDARGRLKNKQMWLSIKLFARIPGLGEWSSNWKFKQFPDKDIQLRINKFIDHRWDERKGCIRLYVDIEYFVDDLDGDPLDKTDVNGDRPVLEIVK